MPFINNFQGLSMQIPTPPPQTGNDTSSRFWQELEAKLAPLEDTYLHWDTLSQKQMPVQGINHKQWWQLLKAKRRARLQALPWTANGASCYWVLDDQLLKLLTQVERLLGSSLPAALGQTLPADNFIAEALASLQLAGGQIDSAAGLDLLCSGCPAALPVEQELLAQYQCLQQLSTEALTPERLLTLNQALQASPSGTWRSAAYALQRDGQTVFNAPEAQEVAQGLVSLCEFANEDELNAERYMHPLLKAIILHYQLAYLHPFNDANGRTARAIFYWQMQRAGYSLAPLIALSERLLSAQDDYFRSFLYTQSDANDVTYFLIAQLSAVLSAIEQYQQRQQEQNTQMQALPPKLTLRQQHILAEMQQAPSRQYRLAHYQQRMQITYETSRTDLMKLAKQGLAQKHKVGKAFVYSARMI
jgi:ribosomal protein L9